MMDVYVDSLNLSYAGLPSTEAVAALTAALDDFFGKKKSKLRR